MIDRPPVHTSSFDHTIAREGWARLLWQQIRRGRGNVYEQDNHGVTLLHQAAGYGNVEYIRVLFAHGADVNAKDGDGWTPLHVVAVYHHDSCVRMLLLHGAHVNAKTKSGATPLHLAVAGGRVANVCVLLDFKANVFAKTKKKENTTGLGDKAREFRYM